MARRPISADSRTVARAVGRAIRALRTSQGLSQEQFAELAGVHRTQVGFLERGERTPGVHTLIQAARALKTTASDLLREAGY